MNSRSPAHVKDLEVLMRALIADLPKLLALFDSLSGLVGRNMVGKVAHCFVYAWLLASL